MMTETGWKPSTWIGMVLHSHEKESPPSGRIVRALRRSSRRAVDDVQKLTGIALGVVSDLRTVAEREPRSRRDRDSTPLTS